MAHAPQAHTIPAWRGSPCTPVIWPPAHPAGAAGVEPATTLRMDCRDLKAIFFFVFGDWRRAHFCCICWRDPRTHGHVDVHPGQAPAPDRLLDLCVALTPHSRLNPLCSFPGRSNSRAASASRWEKGEDGARRGTIARSAHSIVYALLFWPGAGGIFSPKPEEVAIDSSCALTMRANGRRAHGHYSVAQEEDRGAPCVCVCAALRMPSRGFRVVH